MNICDTCLANAVVNKKVRPSFEVLGQNIRWVHTRCGCCGREDQCSFHPHFDNSVAQWVKDNPRNN